MNISVDIVARMNIFVDTIARMINIKERLVQAIFNVYLFCRLDLMARVLWPPGPKVERFK